MARILLVLGLALVVGRVALAEEEAPTTAGAPAVHEDAAPHPEIPANADWVGVPLVGMIAFLFAAAACIGPIVRANTPPPPPEPAHHDEHAGGH